MPRPWRHVSRIQRSPHRWASSSSAPLPPNPFGPVLSNSLATFTFMPDAITGLALTSFRRLGGHLWTNGNANLWQATAFDRAGTVSHTGIAGDILTRISPSVANFQVVPTGVYSTLTLRWIGVPAIADDKFDVTLTLELRDGEDWLRYRISAAWQGTPTRSSMDTLKPLPLLIPPFNKGNDFAVFPSVFGILSQDPTKNLSGIDDRIYPAGRGANLGVWAYYETVGLESWMMWVEDWTPELIRVRYGRSGDALLLETSSFQEDNLTAGNAGRTLGSDYTYCLRPFVASRAAAWVDVGKKYRDRVRAGPAYFYVPPRSQRTDLSLNERTTPLFLDFSVNDTTRGAGLPGITAGLLSATRTNSGVPAATPIVGIVETGSAYQSMATNESLAGDLPAEIAAVYAPQNAYIGVWKPASNALPGPLSWSFNKWFKQDSLGVNTDQLRWESDNDLIHLRRRSRQGFLSGGGDDRLEERADGTYYRERNYPVTAWDAGTHVASVTGAPSTDFSPYSVSEIHATLIPASGAARLAKITVQTLTTTTIKTTGDFVDATGAVVTPVAGDSIELHLGEGASDCPHAAIGSSYYMRQLIANTTQGLFNQGRVCGIYYDTLEIFQSFFTDFTFTCYNDHATWTKIDSNYVRHPMGGGPWHLAAHRDFVAQMKKGGRDAQIAIGGTVGYWVSCEDISEAFHDIFDYTWHTTTSGNLWLSGGGTGKQLKTIPLYQVVHPGATRGHALNQELSSAILNPGAPFNDPVLHAFLGYTLGADWPYGLNFPTLSFFEADGIGFGNWWDDTQFADYTPPGPISTTVKKLRDYWVQIVKAETTYLSGYMNAGDFLGAAVVDFSVTTTTTGLSGSAPYSTQYTSYDTIYERATFPRVTNAIWPHRTDGSFALVLSSWTDTAAAWKGALPSEVNLANSTVALLDGNGLPTTGLTVDAGTNSVTVASVPAFSIRTVIVTPNP